MLQMWNNFVMHCSIKISTKEKFSNSIEKCRKRDSEG